MTPSDRVCAAASAEEPSVARVYVPTTPGRLRDAAASGVLGPAPLTAHAVTPTVREELAGAGEEEWEYAATAAAARAAVSLLAVSGDDPPRRLVVAVDVSRVRPATGENATVVRLDEPVPLSRVAAVLADSEDAAGDVTAARDALRSGAPDAERLLDRCEDHELGWWAAQELDALLAQLPAVSR